MIFSFIMKYASFVFTAHFFIIAISSNSKQSANTRMRISIESAKKSTKLFLKSAIQTFDKAEHIYYNKGVN